MQIDTQQGSATSAKPTSIADGTVRGVIIAHLCNNENKWGAGFVLAINDLSLAARNAYRAFCKDHNDQVPLGTTQFVEVQPDVWIANMIAQNGTDKSKVADGCLVDYNALNTCLKTVFERAVRLGCDVYIPSGIGSGLAGGDKSYIHDIIRTNARAAPIHSLEQQIKFVPCVTLWEFQDTTATSYVGRPAITSQTVVDNALDTPDNSDNDDVIDMDDFLNDI